MPRPPFTPSPRSNHHSPAPAIPAAPVPLDQAPRAVREEDRVGSVVVSWRKVSSPSPDESDASEMPNSRAYRPVENAMVWRERRPDADVSEQASGSPNSR